MNDWKVPLKMLSIQLAAEKKISPRDTRRDDIAGKRWFGALQNLSHFLAFGFDRVHPRDREAVTDGKGWEG